MAKNLVIIPTYKEAENISRMLDAVIALPVRFDVLVVDDGSPDETASIVESFKARYPGQIFLMQR
ncbi:MAG: glycosyltransferase, partial [Saprospiraceae bacterium]